MRKKIVCMLLAFAMIGQTTVYADTTKEQEIHSYDDLDASAYIYADMDSYYTISLPKVIKLDKSTKTSDYAVNVKGGLAGNEAIKVVPDSSFMLSQNNKESVEATVEQEKTTFTCKDIEDAGDSGVSEAGKVSASGLTAGSWEGTFNFNTEVIQQQVTDGVTLTASNLADYVDAETGNAIATSGNVVIPKRVKDEKGRIYKVTAIGDPDTDSGISIFGQDADKVTSVTIPDTVKEIGIRAFYSCYYMKSVNIPKSVTKIGKYAFAWDSALSSFNISNTLTDIGDGAFAGTGLKSLYIPKNVTKIGEIAFQQCGSLTSVEVDDENTVYDSRNNCNAIIETKTNKLITASNNTVIPDDVQIIGKHAFDNKNNLTTLIIPDSVEVIEEYAFFGCRRLTDIKLSSNLKEIQKHAFNTCDKLTSINIPDGVTTIGDNAFYYCYGLNSINIPASVTEIGTAVFGNDNGLTTISVNKNNPKYDSRSDCNAIIEKESNKLIVGINTSIIPEGVTAIGDYAFYYCSKITDINIPDTVTTIGNNAFDNCTNLKNITISDNLRSIGNYAFYYCSKITSFHLPANTINVGFEIFSYCSALSSITVDDDNPKYNSKNNCNAIIEIASNKLVAGCKNTIIPDGVTCIGESAFTGCTGIDTIKIPDSVVSIERKAFDGCHLTLVTLPKNLSEIGEEAFKYNNFTSIKLPDGLIKLNNSSFTNCSKLTSIEIPDSVTEIGNNVFTYCNSLETVKLPSNLKIISNNAFSSCRKISSITYKGTNYTSKAALIAELRKNGVQVSKILLSSTAMED